MSGAVAIIGVGHLGQYIWLGLRGVDSGLHIHLLARDLEKARIMAAQNRFTHLATDHQAALKKCDIVIVATRPDDVVPALTALKFREDQLVISVAAGVDHATLSAACAPAQAARSLPLSSVRIQQSPTLLYPNHAKAAAFLDQLGPVHVLEDEAQFPAATALTGAMYAWLFALMGEAAEWAERSGLHASQARLLVQDTFASAAAMAEAQGDIDFDMIWNSLATPGGISEQGHKVISEQGGFAAFSDALSAVRDRLDGSKT